LGNVFVSGITEGSLGGPNAGGSDVFVAKYDTVGRLLWLQQFGTTGLDRGLDVSADSSGNIYLSGYTDDDLGGPNAGGNDAFVAKFIDGPAGDYNNNGTVDAADYVVWRDGLGTTFTQGEYDVWRANFGKTVAGAAALADTPSTESSTTIPEPVSAVLVNFEVLPLVAARRRKWLHRIRPAPRTN
jgi:hypothetical protein